MNPSQHIFRNKRSAIIQITVVRYSSFYEDIIPKLENCDDVDGISLDFSKVYSKVDSNILINKIKTIDITGKIDITVKSSTKRQNKDLK